MQAIHIIDKKIDWLQAFATPTNNQYIAKITAGKHIAWQGIIDTQNHEQASKELKSQLQTIRKKRIKPFKFQKTKRPLCKFTGDLSYR